MSEDEGRAKMFIYFPLLTNNSFKCFYSKTYRTHDNMLYAPATITRFS